MAEMSIHFNFDDFDAQIAEALADNERAMRGVKRPGEIGAVACRPSIVEAMVKPDEADDVVTPLYVEWFGMPDDAA